MIKTVNSNLVTKKELAAHYGKSLSTIRRWLTKLQIKTSLVYYPKEVILLINEQIKPHIPKRLKSRREYRALVVKPKNLINNKNRLSKIDLEQFFGKADTTIVRWIKTAGIPTSKRLYSPDEVERIRLVGKLFSQKMTAREIKEFLQPDFN